MVHRKASGCNTSAVQGGGGGVVAVPILFRAVSVTSNSPCSTVMPKRCSQTTSFFSVKRSQELDLFGYNTSSVTPRSTRKLPHAYLLLPQTLKVFAVELNLCHVKSWSQFFWKPGQLKWVLQQLSAVKRTWTKVLLASFSPTSRTLINLSDVRRYELIHFVLFEMESRKCFTFSTSLFLCVWSFLPL